MNKPAIDSKARTMIAVSIIVTALLSWTLLPFVIPPFRMYSPLELIEVLFWQGVWLIGWPLALFGGFLSLLLQPQSTDLGTLLFTLIYPAIWILFIHALRAKRWAPIGLCLLLILSFAAVWYQVLNGYDFMVG
jgi:hypothetical protein